MNLAPLTDTPSKTAQQPAGWHANLNCSFEAGAERTVVRRNHSGPLSVQRPFYPDGDVAHVYLLHPPGGVVGGDKLTINVQCSSGAAGLMTTPGAGKFYRSDQFPAVVRQRLESDGGSLEWFPQENIYFAGCNVNLHTEIKLAADASLAWWEINCFGSAIGECFSDGGSVRNFFDLYRDSELQLRERLVIDKHHSTTSSSGLRGHAVFGTLLLSPMHEHCIDQVRKSLEPLPGFSATCFDSLLIVRYLGSSSEEAKNGFVRVWSLLRVALNGRNPVLPRIWAT